MDQSRGLEKDISGSKKRAAPTGVHKACLTAFAFLNFGFVLYVLRSENEFCLCVHLLTFWCNGWKFRNAYPMLEDLV